MRSYARGTKAVLPGKLVREVCEAHVCSVAVYPVEAARAAVSPFVLSFVRFMATEWSVTF